MFFAFFKRISWRIGGAKVELTRSGALRTHVHRTKYDVNNITFLLVDALFNTFFTSRIPAQAQHMHCTGVVVGVNHHLEVNHHSGI